MSIFFQYSPFLLLLCALIAGLMVVWSYLRTTPPLPAGRKALLSSLRFLAVFLVCFLLFQPVARRTTSRVDQPVVAVLVDDSESMRLVSNADTAASTDAAIAGALSALTFPEGTEVRGFRFSSEVAALPASRGNWPDSLHAEGARTDVAGALERVRRELQQENLGAVVLVSDGRYNTGSNPLYAAERYPVPIHTVVVGDTTAQRDVLVGRVTANRVAYVGVEQPVEIDVRSDGFQGSRLTVSIQEGGRILASTTVDVAGDVAQIPVHLAYTPEAPGLRNVTVSVSEMTGELTHENNRQTFPVRVLEQKRQVLVLAGAAGPDVAAVRQILGQDPNTELTVRVQKNESEFYEGALPASFAAFDAMVLLGFPGSATRAEAVSRVREAMESGKPALFVLTRGTNLALLSRTLGDALPAATDASRAGWLEAQPALTPEGAQHPMFAAQGSSAADWLRLPPLLISESRWVASPDARVLAVARVREVVLDDPLVVIRARGGVRTAAVLGAGTWRWKNVPSDLEQWAHLWPEMLSNTLQWITAAHDQRPVRIRPVHEVFAGGEPVSFVGEVYDESLRPLAGAVVQIEVTGEEGRQYPFLMEDVGNGRYALDGADLPEGLYSYRATARRGGKEIGTDSGSFGVGSLTLEHRDTRADPTLMRQIAARSGGRMLSAEEASTLATMIASDPSLEPRTSSVVSDINLRRKPLFLFLIILLLTAEWVLRKRSGLA